MYLVFTGEDSFSCAAIPHIKGDVRPVPNAATSHLSNALFGWVVDLKSSGAEMDTLNTTELSSSPVFPSGSGKINGV